MKKFLLLLLFVTGCYAQRFGDYPSVVNIANTDMYLVRQGVSPLTATKNITWLQMRSALDTAYMKLNTPVGYLHKYNTWDSINVFTDNADKSIEINPFFAKIYGRDDLHHFTLSSDGLELDSLFVVDRFGMIKKWGNITIDDIPGDSTKILFGHGKWKVASGGGVDTSKAYNWTNLHTFSKSFTTETGYLIDAYLQTTSSNSNPTVAIRGRAASNSGFQVLYGGYFVGNGASVNTGDSYGTYGWGLGSAGSNTGGYFIGGGGNNAFGIIASASGGATGNWAGYFEQGSVAIASEKFIVNGSGQITKVNNISASGNTGKALISDGTSFTPTTISAGVDTSKAYTWTNYHYFQRAIKVDSTQNSLSNGLTIKNCALNFEDSGRLYLPTYLGTGITGGLAFNTTLKLWDGAAVQTIPFHGSTNTFTGVNYFQNNVYIGDANNSTGNLFFYVDNYSSSNWTLVQPTVKSGTITITLPGVTTVFPANQGGASTYLQNDGSGNLSWVAGTGASGVTTVQTIDGTTKSANGLVISGANIYAQTADASYPGMVSTGTQGFAGNKTFTGRTQFNDAILAQDTIKIGSAGSVYGYLTLFNNSTPYYTTFKSSNIASSNKTITIPDLTGNMPLLETSNTWTNINEFQSDLKLTDDFINVWESGTIDGSDVLDASGKTSIVTSSTGTLATVNGGVDGKEVMIMFSAAGCEIVETGNLVNIPAGLQMVQYGVLKLKYYNSASKWICIGVENN